MKKRVISALLALCMACSLAGTAWAEDTAPDATAGAPAPAAQTQSLEEKPEPAESKAASDSASSENTVTSDSVSSESTVTSDSASSESTVTSDSASSESTVTSDSASSESTVPSDSASSVSTVTSDSTSSESTVTSDSASSESTVTSDSVSSESTVTSDSASSSVQSAKPNQAPAASAPEAANDGISTYAAGGTSRIYWGNYFNVTVYCVDEDGSVISLDGITPQDRNLTDNNTLTFADWVVGSYETDTDVYNYKEARLDSAGGSVVTSLRASSEGNFGRDYYYYYFYNGSSRQRTLTYVDPWIGSDSDTQTANLYLVYTRTAKEVQPQGDLYIDETVADNGRFTARFQDTVSIPDGAVITYTWQRSLNGTSDWTTVERIAVSGSEGNYIYNMAEDGVYVDVVQDASPNAANVQDDQRYWYKVTATVTTADGAQTTYEAAPVQVPYYIELQNGSFETPVGHKQYEMGAEGLVWKTTGPGSLQNKPGQDIEIIRPSENDQTVQNYGVPVASQGEQFAELNCEAVGTLYQDVMTIPGTTLNWQFDHVARQRRGQGDAWDDPDIWDEMAMVIMPADNADYWANELKNAGSDASAIRGVLQRIESQVDGAYVLDNVRDQPYYRSNYNTSAPNVRGWGHYDSENNGEPYTVPEGQYLTRFFFVSVSSGMGSISLGNCLDNVYFSKDALPLENTESRVTVTKNITGLDAIPQNYSVTFRIGSEEKSLTAANFTQQGQTFTASVSFDYTELSPNSSQRLTVTETGGAVENYQQAISYRVTGGETTLTGQTATTQQFDLPAGQSRTVTFTNTYTPTTAPVTVTKTITGLTDEEEAALVADLTFTLTDTTDSTKTYTTAPGALTLVPGQDGKYNVTIEKVEPGTYTVAESDATVEGYTVETTIPQNVTVELNETNTIEVTNAYTPDNNDLSITKKLVAMHGADITDAKDDTFTFTVTAGQGVDTSKLNGKTFTASQEGKEDQAVTFTNDSATVTVTGEGTVTIKDLPLGNYQVREDESSVTKELSGGYFTGSLYVESESDPSVTSGKPGKVVFNNNYEAYKTLTIKKTVTGEMGTADDWFDFKVTGNNDAEFTLADGQQPTTQDYDFKLNNDGSVTLTHLKQGDTVTVTEKVDKGYKNKGIAVDSEALKEKNPDDGSGHYTIGTAKIDISIPNTSEVNLGTVTFTNEREAVAPTGLESDHNAPFALMVGAAFLAGAALLGNVVLRRRRRWQE